MSSASRLNLSCVDVEEFLSALDIEAKIELREARFRCPMPAHPYGDKNPSAYMNLDSTVFICHSCGWAGNAIIFLAELKEVTRATARNWIAQKWSREHAEIEDVPAFLMRMFAAQHKEQEAEPPFFVPLDEKFYEERKVDWLCGQQPWADYMKNRGFFPQTLSEFDFIYDQISQRPCLTVRTKEGGLVGFKGRAWQESQQPKYMVLGDTERSLALHGERYGFRPYDAAEHVFGINLAQPINGSLIVCEGELNAVSMHQKGFRNTVAPSGSTMSQKQIESIAEIAEQVILLFDSDLATEASAVTAKMKLAHIIESFSPLVRVRVCADHEGDPAEMPEHQIRELIEGAKSSTTYRLEHLLAR